MRLLTMAVFLLSLLASSACGRSGTWEDDPANFKRAWGVDAPDHIVAKHSWYWRSPHFTREEAYYFEFAPNEELVQGFITSNSLRAVADGRPGERAICFDSPVWYAPGELNEYDVWKCQSGTQCMMLRHKQTGAVFFAACQM